MTPALSIAMWVPLPMAMPTRAYARVGARDSDGAGGLLWAQSRFIRL